MDRTPDDPPRRTGRQRLVLAGGLVACLVLVAGAYLAGRIWWKLGQIESIELDDLDVAAADEPQNFLLVGSDSRDAIDASDPNSAVFLGGGESFGGKRADTMVVIRYDPSVERLDVLSIPRDLWLPIAGTGANERINTAYSYEDGPTRLIRTIQDELGIPIHHYAEVDFRGFQALVDELGGVPMYFETIYQDANSGFVVSNPGCTTLDGQRALAFVRSRHLQHMDAAGYWETDPTGDLGRISRQQYFLRAALAKARDRMSLLNPLQFEDLLDVGIAHVRVDTGLSATRLLALAQRYAEFEGDSLVSHSLPVEPWTTAGGAAVLRLEQAEAQPVLNVFRGLDPEDVQPSWVDLVVLNGSGVPEQAGQVRDALEAVGFVVSSVGDVPRPEGEDLAVTRLRFAPGSRHLAELVGRHLTAGAELVEDASLASSRVVLETGADFTTVEQYPLDEVRTPAGATTTTAGSHDGSSSTSAPAATAVTTTAPIGHVPGEPPEGTTCG